MAWNAYAIHGLACFAPSLEGVSLSGTKDGRCEGKLCMIISRGTTSKVDTEECLYLPVLVCRFLAIYVGMLVYVLSGGLLSFFTFASRNVLV